MADWLKKDESLLSQMETGTEEVLLKKKYFVSDANVDRDDPVQLHLVYIQVLSQ
jgi:talin